MADYLKIPEVARRLDVSEPTVRRMVKGGKLPSVFIGGAYRISEEDLAKYIENARVTPGKAPASSQPSLNGLLEEERKWRSQLDLLEMCVQHKISRAEHYERELERGRFSDYETARGASNLAVLALQEFADFTKWVFDKPVRPLAAALEQVPSPVDPRIAEEFEAKEDVMRARAKRTTDLLFKHAEELAETAAERQKLIQKRRHAEEDAAYRKDRSA